MDLPYYFSEFVSRIRLADMANYVDAHKILRDRLKAYPSLKEIYISTFLQGSYRRHTAIRTVAGKSADIDVVVVTNLREEEKTPTQAMAIFRPFLDEYYSGQWRYQDRSILVSLPDLELDLVVTSAPSESAKAVLLSDPVISSFDVTDDRHDAFWSNIGGSNGISAAESATWKLDPLRIPDRSAKEWTSTHPLDQIAWTWKKNKGCDFNYLGVVKILKWWRRITYDEPKYPKGYPLEHITGYCCPDSINGLAQGITETLESIVATFAVDFRFGKVPVLPDHGVPAHNVLKRLTGEDFATFYEKASDAAAKARLALDEPDKDKSIQYWRELLGDEFGEDPDESERILAPAVAKPRTERFA